MDQIPNGSNGSPVSASPSLVVDRLPIRTVALHGMTGPELNRLSDAIWFMAQYRQPKRGLWLLHTNKGTPRTSISNIQKRITRLQHDYGLRPYTVTTFETRGGLHAHIVFLGNREIVERLKSSTAFECIRVDPVRDPGGLTRKYLAKERTPQAGYRRQHVLGGRLRGSHRLDGGGDRVRLSRDLERDAISAGYVESWQHTNARRSAERKPYSPRTTQRLRKTAPRPAGQLPLLPELNRPVARLRDFGGGFMPPSVAREIEFLRGQLGLSQTQLASLIGRSQGQLANALRGARSDFRGGRQSAAGSPVAKQQQIKYIVFNDLAIKNRGARVFFKKRAEWRAELSAAPITSAGPSPGWPRAWDQLFLGLMCIQCSSGGS
jgi:hypothetical protein